LPPSIPTLKSKIKLIPAVGIATIAQIANRVTCVSRVSRVSLVIGAKIVSCASIVTLVNRHIIAAFANRSILANRVNF